MYRVELCNKFDKTKFVFDHIIMWSSRRWLIAIMSMLLLSVFVSNVQGTWVYATTFSANAHSGTVAIAPPTVTCGNGSQQVGFLDASGASLGAINLDDVDDTVDIQVCVDGMTLGGADTAQIVIEHDDSVLELINPTCEGLLGNGFVSPSTKRTADDQASAFICSKPGGVSGSEGAVLKLTARRTGAGTDTLAFRTSGTLTTAFYESGVLIPVSGFDSIVVQQQNPPATPTSVPVFVPSFNPPTATPVPTVAAGPAAPPLSFEAPTEPTDFVGTPGLRLVTLTWAAPEESSNRSIDDYTIQNLRTGEIVRLRGEVLTYTFTGLDPSSSYHFTIKASTGLGVGPGTGVGPIVPWDLPGVPTNAESVIGSDGKSASVTWGAPESDGGTPITGYVVIASSGTSVESREVSVVGTSVEFEDLLVPGSSFELAVHAKTLAGLGTAASAGSVSRVAESVQIVTLPTVTIVPTETPLPPPESTTGPVSSGSKSGSISVFGDEKSALESALEAATGSQLSVGEVVVKSTGNASGFGLVIPVDGLSATDDIQGVLSLLIGQLTLEVIDGIGTAEVRFSDELVIVGGASISTSDGGLGIQVSNPVLQYSPVTVDDGSFAGSSNSIDDVAVSFAVGADLLPDEVSLTTTYSADAAQLAASTGTTFALEGDDELAYFVSVEKSGITQDDLGDNSVTMNVSLAWLDSMVAAGKEIAITKVSDSGEVFTESAQYERLADIAVCTVTFAGAAGGFSLFVIYGSVNTKTQPEPQTLSNQVPNPTSTPVPPTSTVVAEQTPVSSVTPEVAPSPAAESVGDIEPTRSGSLGDGEVGGSGPNVAVIVAIGLVVVAAGGVVISAYNRRSNVSTVGLFVIATSAGLLVLLAGNVSVAQADGEPDLPYPDIRRLNPVLLGDSDKLDFRYRNVGSGVRALSEAYRAGVLDERPEFAEMTKLEAIDPSIDVSIWFASAADVNLELIGQTATVLNHVGDVVEARVPIRFAHQLSYMPGVLRVDRIVPPFLSAITSEGAAVHGSPAWNTVGLDGTGIKVGIIDVGFQGWSAISPSELPTPAGVRCYTSAGNFTSDLSDCENGEVHGTAVAEAVSDIAPAVIFYIANPISKLDLANTEVWLASQGVTIINFSAEMPWDGPGDGTSPSSDSPLKSVDQAVRDGILWVNAAGNSAQDHWYGTYADTDSNGFLNLSGSLQYQTVQRFKANEFIQLRWEDTWGGATSDLKLYLTDSSNLIVTSADTAQAGGASDNPYEFIEANVYSTDRIWVEHVSGPAPDWIELRVFLGSGFSDPVAAGSIGNPASSPNAGMLAVGAAAWSSTSTIEDFSSQGPTTDGRTKPDIVGADRGESQAYLTSTGNGDFPGTSQASPHVAGLAALILQRFPTMTPTELATYLKTNADDRGTAGPDNTWGYGFAGLTAPTAPTAVADSYSVDEDAVLSVPAPGVLTNDSDDADAFTPSLVATATDGSVTLNSDGSFAYTPDANFNGSDSFTYKDSDLWQTSSTVSVGIVVSPIADVSGTSTSQGVSAPGDVSMSLTGTGSSTGTSNLVVGSDGAFKKHLATDTFTFTTSADGYVTRTKTSQSVTTADLSLGATQLRAGDADGDGDVDSADATVLLAAFVAGLPDPANRVDGSGNTVDLNADGFVNAIDLSLWASNFNLAGPMSWDTTPTTPPLAIAGSYWVYQDTQLSISGIGVLGNDHDQENDSLTATVVDGPEHGSLALNSNGSFTYDPVANYIGVDSFTYTAADSQTTSIKTTVVIDVRTAPVPTATPTPGTTVGTTVGG